MYLDCLCQPSLDCLALKQFHRSTVQTVSEHWQPAGLLLIWRNAWGWGGTRAGWQAGDLLPKRVVTGRVVMRRRKTMMMNGLNRASEETEGGGTETLPGDKRGG